MLRLKLLVLWTAAVLLGQTDTPSFRIDVKLVNVIATVKDTNGGPVGVLEREDFTVLAAGVPQEIAVFERQTDRPLSVALLFDASLSVAKELQFERLSAVRFVRSLLGSGAHPADRIAVYSFSSDVQEVQGFTRSIERLEKGLLSIRPDSGTCVYDALYLCARELERRDGRKVIIIITDGGDTTSSATFAQALEATHLADAVVYSVIVVPITNDAGRNLGGENALQTLSAGAGGLTFRQYSEKDLDQAFRQIERDLRVQYLLGFYPKNIPQGPERFHRIDVRVARPGVRVLARSGYFVDSERPSGPQPNITIDTAPERSAPRSQPRTTKKSPRSIH